MNAGRAAPGPSWPGLLRVTAGGRRPLASPPIKSWAGASPGRQALRDPPPPALWRAELPSAPGPNDDATGRNRTGPIAHPDPRRSPRLPGTSRLSRDSPTGRNSRTRGPRGKIAGPGLPYLTVARIRPDPAHPQEPGRWSEDARDPAGWVKPTMSQGFASVGFTHPTTTWPGFRHLSSKAGGRPRRRRSSSIPRKTSS